MYFKLELMGFADILMGVIVKESVMTPKFWAQVTGKMTLQLIEMGKGGPCLGRKIKNLGLRIY